MEGDLVVAVGRDFLQIIVPGFARIDAQLLARLAGQKIPGALDIRGGERLAVVPFDPLAQREGQFGAFLVPRPVGGQIRDNRLQAGLRHVLLIHDQVVEDVHHRLLGGARRLLQDRHARRAVEMRQPQNPAAFLRTGRPGSRHCHQQCAGSDYVSNLSGHSRLTSHCTRRDVVDGYHGSGAKRYWEASIPLSPGGLRQVRDRGRSGCAPYLSKGGFGTQDGNYRSSQTSSMRQPL